MQIQIILSIIFIQANCELEKHERLIEQIGCLRIDTKLSLEQILDKQKFLGEGSYGVITQNLEKIESFNKDVMVVNKYSSIIPTRRQVDEVFVNALKEIYFLKNNFKKSSDIPDYYNCSFIKHKGSEGFYIELKEQLFSKNLTDQRDLFISTKTAKERLDVYVSYSSFSINFTTK